MTDKFILVVSTETDKLLKLSEMKMKHIDLVVTDEILTDTSIDIKNMLVEYVGEKMQHNTRQSKPWYRKERW